MTPRLINQPPLEDYGSRSLSRASAAVFENKEYALTLPFGAEKPRTILKDFEARLGRPFRGTSRKNGNVFECMKD